LVFVWRVDAVETDTFSLLVVQDFDGTAVEDGDDITTKRGGNDSYRKNENS
jgi:hypothetical protein